MDDYLKYMLDTKENFQDKDRSQINIIREELKKYNMIDFLENISVLMLFPENQSKFVIFQAMISTALSIPKEELNFSNIMSYGKFKKIVNEFSNLQRIEMVDPPEFPFVLPVLYYNNYHLFMGTNSISTLDFNNLLKVFYLSRNKIENNLYNKLNKIIIGLLDVSEKIYKKTKIDLKKLKSYDKDLDIYIPNSSVLAEYKEYIKFPKKYINLEFADFIEELQCDFGDVKEKEILNFDNQIFYDKPFLVFNNEYILLDATSIISLLMKKIIKDTLDSESINIVNEYNNFSYMEINKFFARMGNMYIDPQKFDIELIINENYVESLYFNDIDGIILNIIIFDNGEKFKENKKYKSNLNKEFIGNRIEYIKNILLNKKVNKDKIIVVITPITIGRDMYYSLKKCIMNDFLILAPYEIETISINETKENMFLQRYLIARQRLKDYEKNSFSELNMIALYVNKDYSFYLDDTVDLKDIYLFCIGEYSADYILKAYNKQEKHLCEINEKSKIEVIKDDKNVFFCPELFISKIMNQVYENNNFILWCISDEIKNSNLYSIYKTFIDIIMYWFNQMSQFFEDKVGKHIIRIKTFNKYDDFLFKKEISKSIEELLNYEEKDNEIIILLTPELLQYFNYFDNSREKEFIKYILKILKYEIDEIKINKIFENQYKKKTISIDSAEEPYMVPIKDKDQLQISHSDENIILDNIGSYLIRKLEIKYGIINDDQIINKVVEELYLELLKRIEKFDKNKLLNYLYLEFEKIISNLHIRKKYYSNDIECYPEHELDIKKNFNELNKISVALKFLIELESSLKVTGNKDISYYEIEYMLAMASEIIEWAYVGDLVHYHMMNSPVELLKSNRIGFDHEIIDKASISMFKAREDKMTAEGKEKIKELEKYETKTIKNELSFEKAFKEEFGFELKDYIEVVIYLLEYSSKNNKFLNNITEININFLINELKNKIEKTIILDILDKISLQERENYLEPPIPYRKEDVYPWRFNRELSITRKPLIIYGEKIIYGYRILSNSVGFLYSLISSCKFQAKSNEMKRYISKIEKIKGQDFNDLVYNRIASYKEFILDKNVKKINKKRIVDNANNDLGDIDVLCISENKGIINVIETKNFELSKNFYEIYNEYKKMFDVSNNKSFYNKHMRRVDWIKEHIDDIKIEYHLSDRRWEVKYLFIVENALVSKDVFEIDTRITTLMDLNKNILLKK